VETQEGSIGNFHSTFQEVEELLHDVLLFRIYQRSVDQSNLHEVTSLDKVAEDELEPTDANSNFEVSETILDKTILYSYNAAVRNLRDLSSPPQREEVTEWFCKYEKQNFSLKI
jgi:hypothetical protein